MPSPPPLAWTCPAYFILFGSGYAGLGSTGVGKTNFIKALTEPLPQAIDSVNRTEVAKKHKISLSKHPFEFVDTPGQEGHEKRRLDAIREQMGRGPMGVINLVSYGYHEYGVAGGDVFNAAGAVKEAFLAAHRKIEIDQLSSWVGLLGDRVTTAWFITLITKADLWWDMRAQVVDHYSKGKYLDALGPAQSLRPITLEFASVVHRFFGKGPVASTFDDQVRETLHRRMYQTIFDSIGK